MKLLKLLILVFLLVACASESDAPASTPRPTSTPRPDPTAVLVPTKPDIDYTLLDGEDYGSAGSMGHSYRLLVDENAPEDAVAAAAHYEANRNKSGRVSITVFAYVGHDPREDGNWIADRFFLLVTSSGRFRECNGPC